MKRLALLALLLLAGVAAAQAPPWNRPALVGQPVGLKTITGAGADLGPLTFLGALDLTSPQTSELGGVSGIDADRSDGVTNHLIAVTDAGSFLEFDLILDENGAPSQAANLLVTPLLDPQGKPFQNKRQGDAEGLTILPGEPTIVVSFEQDHRLIAYRRPIAPGAAQTPMTFPAQARRAPDNSGMEALAAVPGNFLAVGFEDRQVFLCYMPSGPCEAAPVEGGPGLGFGLTSFDLIPGTNGDLAAIYRRLAISGGFEVRIERLVRTPKGFRAESVAHLPSGAPNFEGIAVLPRPGGGRRLLLVSDNGFNAREPTRLALFDWL